ncbi:DUF5080 family protein [Staphylococcus petrasii]|uniref:DUF5080 family protein n=1 Tax=Staphylococcus petrasii TaxID=1276936 RepID=UPI001F5AA0D2|nr:DUF5080 family protein [Staphylococcus petrasii]MCI2773563.1 DUF5080 family protein [Staphylococcus petrasii]
MFEFYAKWFWLIEMIENFMLFFGAIGLVFVAILSLEQIQERKKLWYVGIFLIYAALFGLLIYFSDKETQSYNVVFIILYLPYLYMCYLSSHYLVKRPLKTKLEFVTGKNLGSHKVTNKEMKSLKEELHSAKINALAGSICAAFMIVAFSAKLKFIHEDNWFAKHELPETIANLAGVGGFVFLVSAFLIVIYFIIDMVLWNKRGKFPGLIFRPIIMCLWQFLFLISL